MQYCFLRLHTVETVALRCVVAPERIGICAEARSCASHAKAKTSEDSSKGQVTEAANGSVAGESTELYLSQACFRLCRRTPPTAIMCSASTCTGRPGRTRLRRIRNGQPWHQSNPGPREKIFLLQSGREVLKADPRYRQPHHDGEHDMEGKTQVKDVTTVIYA